MTRLGRQVARDLLDAGLFVRVVVDNLGISAFIDVFDSSRDNFLIRFLGVLLGLPRFELNVDRLERRGDHCCGPRRHGRVLLTDRQWPLDGLSVQTIHRSD